jgi:hypothetical protein
MQAKLPAGHQPRVLMDNNKIKGYVYVGPSDGEVEMWKLL